MASWKAMLCVVLFFVVSSEASLLVSKELLCRSVVETVACPIMFKIYNNGNETIKDFYMNADPSRLLRKYGTVIGMTSFNLPSLAPSANFTHILMISPYDTRKDDVVFKAIAQPSNATYMIDDKVHIVSSTVAIPDSYDYYHGVLSFKTYRRLSGDYAVMVLIFMIIVAPWTIVFIMAYKKSQKRYMDKRNKAQY